MGAGSWVRNNGLWGATAQPVRQWHTIFTEAPADPNAPVIM